MVHGRYLQAIINQLPVAKVCRTIQIQPTSQKQKDEGANNSALFYCTSTCGLESISLHHEDVDGLLSSGTTIFQGHSSLCGRPDPGSELAVSISEIRGTETGLGPASSSFGSSSETGQFRFQIRFQFNFLFKIKCTRDHTHTHRERLASFQKNSRLNPSHSNTNIRHSNTIYTPLKMIYIISSIQKPKIKCFKYSLHIHQVGEN